jgi:DMSO/TMAO reductase YedYZ heme-binding membrane subunit
VSFGPVDLLVPFAASWRPGAVAWGVVALYLLLAVEVTSLVRSRLPARVWHRIHLASYGLYLTATVHLLTAGSEAGDPWLVWCVVASLGAVVFFTAYRFVGPGRAASVRRRSVARPSG